MIWWHSPTPALYANYGCLVRHLVTEIRAFTDKLTQHNGDLLEGWQKVLDSSQEKYATVDVGDDQYDKHLTVLMNASDCMHYMMLKASRPDFGIVEMFLYV